MNNDDDNQENRQTIECKICYELKYAFIDCYKCFKKICTDCFGKINQQKKCPFCRTCFIKSEEKSSERNPEENFNDRIEDSILGFGLNIPLRRNTTNSLFTNNLYDISSRLLSNFTDTFTDTDTYTDTNPNVLSYYNSINSMNSINSINICYLIDLLFNSNSTFNHPQNYQTSP